MVFTIQSLALEARGLARVLFWTREEGEEPDSKTLFTRAADYSAQTFYECKAGEKGKNRI